MNCWKKSREERMISFGVITCWNKQLLKLREEAVILLRLAERIVIFFLCKEVLK